MACSRCSNGLPVLARGMIHLKSDKTYLTALKTVNRQRKGYGRLGTEEALPMMKSPDTEDFASDQEDQEDVQENAVPLTVSQLIRMEKARCVPTRLASCSSEAH